ncbi:MAG: molybdopterin molybdotransferase MoeA [Thiobacillaceae bacterium]|nr:molybdopterin molybdotransferase MoeA [Thiobacillaceae bacterium]MDW8324813.1 molybdopterin molybdotransferase MoeA [Burkholderiales bacterium]
MHEPLLTLDQAVERLLAAAEPVRARETVALADGLGRVLAAPVVSPVAVPPLDNAAMDGYALRTSDWAAGRPLKLSQRIQAGQVGAALQPGEAARIFTGAPVPAGADAVAMQEDCEAQEGWVLIKRPPQPGEHIRRAGEDIAAGQTVLTAGERLTAARLGVAASTGATALTVHRRLRVAVFFTGDELVPPGRPLAPGQIYNSNRAVLTALLQGLGAEVEDLGEVPDDLEATVATLRAASARADVVLTSGGVSVGEADYVRAAVERLGRIEFWRVAMKPGKPLTYGRLGATDFLGLPGNPVSAFVVFGLFVRPFLLRRMGAAVRPPLRLPVPAGFAWDRPGNRREFLRARIEEGRAVLYPNQSSGVLTSVAWAEGLIDLDIGRTVAPGELVPFIPMSELLV